MFKILISELVNAVSGRIVINKYNKDVINYISTASNNIEENTLFVPIIGETKDGHDYMEDAYNNGCRNFLIDTNHKFYKEDINLIEVENTTKAFGAIAKFYRSKFNIPYIAVTGSVGKTSTKDIIYSVIKEEYCTLKNEGNYNNEIGLPKTIFRLNKDYDIAILEMGLSYKGDIEYLSNIVRPNIAVISNIGMSHIENFEDQSGIFEAKMEIAKFLKTSDTLVVNGDDKFLKTLKNKKLNYKLLTYGFDKDNDIVCTHYEIDGDKINFAVTFQNEIFNITIPSNAKHNIYNSMAAIIVGKLLNISNEKIVKGLSDFSITKGRLTVIKKKNITIIDDTYNASCDSMKSALNVLSLYKNRKVAILGSILETGKYDEKLHREVGRNVLNNADILIAVGNSAKYIKEEAVISGMKEENVYSYNDYQELIKNIKKLIKKDDVILLKASHGIMLNKVVKFLEENYED